MKTPERHFAVAESRLLDLYRDGLSNPQTELDGDLRAGDIWVVSDVIYVIDGGDRFGVAGATTDPAAVVNLLLEADTSYHKAFGLDPCDPTVELAGVADAARQRLEEEEAGATSFGPLRNRWAHFSVRAFRVGRLAP